MIVAQRIQNVRPESRSSRQDSPPSVSIAGTAYPFPGENDAHAILLRAACLEPIGLRSVPTTCHD